MNTILQGSQLLPSDTAVVALRQSEHLCKEEDVKSIQAALRKTFQKDLSFFKI
jgi:hypothetical protein